MSALPHSRRSALSRLAVLSRLGPLLEHAPVVVEHPAQLLTERLLLRPLEPSDRVEFLELLSHNRDHLREHCPLHRAGEPDAEVFSRQLAFARAAAASGLAWRRLVCLRDGTIIGALNLNEISSEPDRHAELNVWLDRSHTGSGLAREAVDAALAHAFRPEPNGLGLDRIIAYIAPANTASLRIVQSAGFSRTERSRPVQLNLAGEWKSHVVYELTGDSVVRLPRRGLAQTLRISEA